MERLIHGWFFLFLFCMAWGTDYKEDSDWSHYPQRWISMRSPECLYLFQINCDTTSLFSHLKRVRYFGFKYFERLIYTLKSLNQLSHWIMIDSDRVDLILNITFINIFRILIIFNLIDRILIK